MVCPSKISTKSGFMMLLFSWGVIFWPAIQAFAEDNIDFAAKSSGWHILDEETAKTAPKLPRKVKPKEKWIPIDPSYFNAPANGEPRTSLMLQNLPGAANSMTPNPGAPGYPTGAASTIPSGGSVQASFTSKGRVDKDTITEQVKQLVKTGNISTAVAYLWDIKWKGKLSPDLEKLVDSALVQLGDDKALNTPLMLAHTPDNGLVQGIQNMQSAGRIAEAILLAKEFERRNPNNESAASGLAHLYYKAEKFSDALASFKRADEINPKTSEYINNVIVCCTRIGALEELQNARRSFVQRFPDDPRTPDLEKAIAYYQKDFSKTREREAKGNSGSGAADYAHFSKNSMPLKIYIPDITYAAQNWQSEPDLSLDYYNIVCKAADEWKEASNGRVSFTTTTNKDDANIIVEWMDNPGSMTHSSALGSTSVVSNSKKLPQHKIDLLVPSKKFGGESSRFYYTTVHEFGHALGLSHSSAPDDIMYNTNLPDRHMTDNDRSRITELYK